MMTKKKYNSRPKHQKDVLGDTSEEEFNTSQIQGKSCPHVTRGIHFGRVKKSLKSTQSIVTCSGCSNEVANEDQPEVWLCLQCGYRGCGRMSENKHGLQHFKTLHSDCHSLVLSTTSGSVWCYDCDDEISFQSSHNLKQCVEFVMKMSPACVDSKRPSVPVVNKFATQKNLQVTVIKEESNVQNSEGKIANEKVSKCLKSKENNQKIGIKGLRNLGNTCFFNAVMQNLNQTSLLYYELKNVCTPSYLWQVPELSNNEMSEVDSVNILKLSLPHQFSLTNSLFNFFDQMSATASSKYEIFSPTQLFGEISKKNPQLRHFQQQDSHELLRQLLDGVRQEEIKRQKKAILRHFDLENVIPENVDEETKKQIKAYSCYASHTIIEKVFGGLMISTVLCEECKASSQVFEPFMDLSLPLFEEKQQENNELLNGMLDGGEQDHIKPLRSKKTGWDSDDNAQEGYALPKPKNDLGKPSKYQEKKLKQKARKEKKMAKYSRNKNNSQNEHCDNSNNRINESVENEEEEEQDAKGSEETENQNEEVWEVPDLFGDNLKSKDDSESCPETNSSIQIDVEKSSNLYTTGSTDDEGEKVDINGKCLVPCYAETLSQVKHEDENESVHYVEVKSKQQQLDELLDEFGKLFREHQNKSAISAPNIEEAPAGINSKILAPCPVETEIIECVQPTEILTEVKLGDEDQTEEVNRLVLRNQNNDKECVVNQNENPDGIVKESDAKEIEVFEEISAEVAETQNVADDSLCNLTQTFSKCTKLDSDQCNIDDRIHVLSMQVRDVRIRRDSDQQENLLNSSESADDYESKMSNCTSPKSSVEDTCSIENGDKWSHSVSEQQTKDWISKTLTTLKLRHQVSPLECSINSCLSHFTKPELLTGNNKFRCETCTELKIKRTGNKKDVVYSNASKQMLIFSPPAILTLHLKRFQQVGMTLRKVNRFVEFPLILDLSPYCCSACSILPHMSSVDNEILYSLYGIVEHSGRLTSGHYTAYVKSNRRTVSSTFECQLPLAQCDLEQLLHKFSGATKVPSESSSGQSKEDVQWFYISDTHVKEVSEAQVLKCQAYLLFYERIK